MFGRLVRPLNKTCCDHCGRPLLPKKEAPDLPERFTFAGLCKELDPETGRAKINYFHKPKSGVEKKSEPPRDEEDHEESQDISA